MDYRERYARLFALVVGVVLIVAGVIGFFYESSFTSDKSVRDGVFGILDVNGWHNLVHIATGVIAVALAYVYPREFALGFGVVYLIVAIWGFIIGDGDSILSIIPVNTEDNVLHAILALAGFAVYGLTAPERRHAVPPARPTPA
jgi:Domain of unknown function (DUF4383)